MARHRTTGRARRAWLDCISFNMAKPRGQRTPVVLIVLDGWGFRPGRDGNAIELGDTPTWHRLWTSAPRTLLNASGQAVGLPEGLIGNSEVGHLNLGAGRVVPQDIVRISQAIARGDFFQLPPLTALCHAVQRGGGTLHRSEEHTSELQSRPHLVCRLLLEKKKKLSNYGGRPRTGIRQAFSDMGLCFPVGGLRGDYLAIARVGFGETVRRVVFYGRSLTGRR